jgi:hypothetical protein
VTEERAERGNEARLRSFACAISNDPKLLTELSLKASEARFSADGIRLVVATSDEFVWYAEDPIALLIDVDSVPDWEHLLAMHLQTPRYVVLVRSRETRNGCDERFGVIVTARSVKDALTCVRRHLLRTTSMPRLPVSQVVKAESGTDRFGKVSEG